MKVPLLIAEKGGKNPTNKKWQLLLETTKKNPPNKTNTNENQHKNKQNESKVQGNINLYVNFRSVKASWYSK